MLAISLMCCTLTHLGIVWALRPHMLHFSLLVLPVEILRSVLWSECTNKITKTPTHSFVIAGHLHWLSVKLPDMYGTGGTTEFSWRSCAC